MKKIIYLIAGISLFSSCSDLLDELPDSQVPVNSPERIKRVLVNAYPVESTKAKRFPSKITSLKGFLERMKIADRYCAKQIIRILYPLTTEKRLNKYFIP